MEAWQDLLEQGLSLAQVVVVALLAGWAAERLLDTGLRIRGIALLAGLIGLYAGTWVWQLNGWDGGPTVVGHPLFPTLTGALGVCAIFKLAALGAVGPRW